jgi:hypothetical protein
VSRWREPAAFIVLGALVIDVGLAAAARIAGAPLVEAALRISGSGHALLLVVAAALAVSCVVVDRTAHARLIASLGAVLAVITLGWTTAYAVLTWMRLGQVSVAGVLGLLVALTPAALALSLLIVLLRPSPPATGAVAEPAPELPAPEPPDPQLQPTWAPEVATGAAWRTAGEAAAGAPAGHPPAPQPQAPATPDRHPWWGPAGTSGPPAAESGHPWADQEQRHDEEPWPTDRP